MFNTLSGFVVRNPDVFADLLKRVFDGESVNINQIRNCIIGLKCDGIDIISIVDATCIRAAKQATDESHDIHQRALRLLSRVVVPLIGLNKSYCHSCYNSVSQTQICDEHAIQNCSTDSDVGTASDSDEDKDVHPFTEQQRPSTTKSRASSVASVSSRSSSESASSSLRSSSSSSSYRSRRSTKSRSSRRSVRSKHRRRHASERQPKQTIDASQTDAFKGLVGLFTGARPATQTQTQQQESKQVPGSKTELLAMQEADAVNAPKQKPKRKPKPEPVLLSASSLGRDSSFNQLASAITGGSHTMMNSLFGNRQMLAANPTVRDDNAFNAVNLLRRNK